jgi:hypothetical protein
VCWTGQLHQITGEKWDRKLKIKRVILLSVLIVCFSIKFMFMDVVEIQFDVDFINCEILYLWDSGSLREDGDLGIEMGNLNLENR